MVKPKEKPITYEPKLTQTDDLPDFAEQLKQMREQIAKNYEVKVAATCEEMEAYKQSFERSCEQRVAKAKQEYKIGRAHV